MSEENKRLVIGDYVQVGWANDACVLRGTIDYIPYAAGDSWIIIADDGTPHYVQQFECMWRIERARKEGT